MNTNVGILLATYNGESYIGEQLESLIQQTEKPGCILVSDDNSTDGTKLQVESCKRQDVNIEWHTNISGCTGHLANFSYLCGLAHAHQDVNYWMFCDQDDVWLGHKIQTLKKYCEKAEQSNGRAIVPTLVHCDLNVANEQMDEIAPSFIRFQGFPDPRKQKFPAFLHQNVVTGCATLFNRRLLEIAHPIPKSAVIHDHWIALCAVYFGQIEYIDQPLVKYRQHGNNSIGATSVKSQRSFFKPYVYRMIFTFPRHLSQAVEQAKALEKRRAERELIVKEDSQRWVVRFASVKELSFWRRMMSLNHFFPGKRGLKERAYLLFVLLILPYIKAKKEDK